MARKDAEVLRGVAEMFENDDRERAVTLYQAAAAAGDSSAAERLSELAPDTSPGLKPQPSRQP